MPRPKIRHSVKIIPFHLIDCDPNQPRRRFKEEKLSRLSTSILANGLAQLTSVKANPGVPGRWIVVMGERRFRSLQKAGFTEHEFIVMEGELGSSFDLSVVENRHREDLDEIEEAELMQAYFKAGRTMDEVMQVTGYSDFTIYNRLELLKLHPDVQQMIIDDTLTSTRALTLRRTPLDDQIRKAHLLLSGSRLDFEQERLQRERRARRTGKIASSDALEVVLGRVMKLAWTSKSSVVHVGTLLDLPPGEFIQLLRKINDAPRETLEQRFRNLSQITLEFARRLEAMRLHKPMEVDAGKQIPVSPSMPATASPSGKNKNDATPTPTDVRPPIVFNGNAPPEYLSIRKDGKARLEMLRRVLTCLLYNPERHGRVNLSKQHLRGVLALSIDKNPEDLALGVLRAAWASWDLSPKDFIPGEHRQFLERLAQIRSYLGKTLAEVINAAWAQDKSADPVDLRKLVVEKPH